ncbi:DnaD domain-containing protein [Virgibacillus flavescens]|uniref:DnaD domain-containing protein n=1 Tax=Virgibacillus flavescens TaxID=1611422 RepID=UPI003D32769B
MMMNYIKELNGFKNWVEVNELSANAILLWHTLMIVNNSAGWKRMFNAPNALVGNLSGLSVQRINEARKQLMKHGLIRCEIGKKGKAPIYEMLPFCQKTEPLSESFPEQYSEPFQEQSRNIPKQKLKQESREEETRDEPIVSIYEANIGKLSPLAKQEFLEWCNKLGDDVMVEAIKLETKHNGRTFRYLERILQEWEAADVDSIAAVEEYQEKKRVMRDNTVPFRKQHAAGKKSVFDEMREEAGLL